MITDLGERLALIIDAKTDNAVSNIRKLSVEEKAAADRAEILKAKLADLETRAAKQGATPGGVSKSTALQLSRTRSELAGLEANLAQIPAGAGLAERGLAKLGLQGTVTGTALVKGLGIAAGATLAFGTFEYLKHGVQSFEELAAQVRSVANAASSSTEDASRLVEITNALGLSSDNAALGVFRLGKNIQLTPEKLSAYGIAVAKTKDGNTDLIKTLFNVADAYQKTTDPAKRAALVFQAFGRAGTTMLPILNANRKQLEEIAAQAQKHGLIFSPEDLQRARDLQIATHEMKDSLNALGIEAARTLVPALTEAASLITELADSKVGTGIKDLAYGFAAILTGPLQVARALGAGGGGHKKDPRAQAEADIANEQAQAAQNALQQAALATLGNASSILATPGQGLADAKQALKDAQQTLGDAVATRNKAAKDLVTVRAGSPAADATAVEAAVARVTAATAKLRAAEYIGGDARVAGAQATLLSAQDSLNKLRAKGGTETNSLAAATERLHKANEAVAAARAKEQAAQQARNQATGFSATDIQSQLVAQLRDKTALAGAQQKIAGLGATPELIGFLDQANQRQAGTLVKYANTATAAMVASMNETLAQEGVQESIFTSIAGNPDDWRAAGADRAKDFAEGFTQGTGRFGPYSGIAAPATGRPTASFMGPVAGGGITVKGDINLHGVEDPAALARKLAAESRHRALSGGVPTGASL